MIRYRCPKCLSPMEAPESLAGQVQACPACGTAIATAGPSPMPMDPSRSTGLRRLAKVGVILSLSGWAPLIGAIVYAAMSPDQERLGQAITSAVLIGGLLMTVIGLAVFVYCRIARD